MLVRGNEGDGLRTLDPLGDLDLSELDAGSRDLRPDLAQGF
jgi:hypothetical protein